MRTALRPAYDRVLVMHRRYTGSYGDALASGITYATLVGGVPAAVLLHAAAPPLVRRLDPTPLLPGTVRDLAADLPVTSLSLRLALVVALAWATVRLVRALRTSVRAVCGQRAGTGNPVRDLRTDLRLLAALGGLVLGALVLTTVAGVAGAFLAWTAVLTVLPRLLTHPAAGRPSWTSAARTAPFGAALLVAVALSADAYVRLTEQVHEDVYRSAGVLVGVAVWVSVSARLVLRTVSWSATAP